MQPDIVAVPLSEKPDLWTMYQRYARELAPMANIQPVEGEITDPTFDNYWHEDGHWPFWAVRDGVRIGFALICFVPEYQGMRMAQFFIAPEYRRENLGLYFARRLLTRYPGTWRIRQMAANTKAVAFWRRVVEPFDYSQATFVDKGLERVEQTVTVC
jgi:predicted acetyltransferase